MAAIRALDDLLGRCRVDELSGCWIFGGSLSEDREPRIWSVVFNQAVSVGTMLSLFTTGARPAAGVIYRRTCETRGCANPEHRIKSDRTVAADAARAPKSTLHRARISASKRAKSKNCNERIAAEIRASSEPLRVFADKYGLSVSTCSMIRRQVEWKPLGVSAFSTWGALVGNG